MRRFCPSEEVLGEYIMGCLPRDERPEIEKHLADCEKCRTLVSEAQRAMRSFDPVEAKLAVFGFLKKNFWPVMATVFLLTSFLFPKYFFQFLLISLITGLKWVSDSRVSKTIIMIQEKKNGVDKNSPEEHSSRSKNIS